MDHNQRYCLIYSATSSSGQTSTSTLTSSSPKFSSKICTIKVHKLMLTLPKTRSRNLPRLPNPSSKNQNLTAAVGSTTPAPLPSICIFDLNMAESLQKTPSEVLKALSKNLTPICRILCSNFSKIKDQGIVLYKLKTNKLLSMKVNKTKTNLMISQLFRLILIPSIQGKNLDQMVIQQKYAKYVQKCILAILH